MGKRMVPPPQRQISTFLVVLTSGEQRAIEAQTCLPSGDDYVFTDAEGAVVLSILRSQVSSISSR